MKTCFFIPSFLQALELQHIHHSRWWCLRWSVSPAVPVSVSPYGTESKILTVVAKSIRIILIYILYIEPLLYCYQWKWYCNNHWYCFIVQPYYLIYTYKWKVCLLAVIWLLLRSLHWGVLLLRPDWVLYDLICWKSLNRCYCIWEWVSFLTVTLIFLCHTYIIF